MQIRELGAGDLQQLLELYRDLHAEDAPPPSLTELEASNAAIVPNLTRAARPYALVENVESVGFDGRSKQAFIIHAP